jgi:hypothetical protein
VPAVNAENSPLQFIVKRFKKEAGVFASVIYIALFLYCCEKNIDLCLVLSLTNKAS